MRNVVCMFIYDVQPVGGWLALVECRFAVSDGWLIARGYQLTKKRYTLCRESKQI